MNTQNISSRTVTVNFYAALISLGCTILFLIIGYLNLKSSLLDNVFIAAALIVFDVLITSFTIFCGLAGCFIAVWQSRKNLYYSIITVIVSSANLSLLTYKILLPFASAVGAVGGGDG